MFRDIIIGYKHVDTLMDLLPPKNASKECVGENSNTDQTGTNKENNGKPVKQIMQMMMVYNSPMV